jgi:threonine synthase
MYKGLIDKYRQYLPVSETTPVVTLNEGNTPLIKADNLAKTQAADAQRAAQRMANKANPGAAAAKAGFQRGANSVGVMGGLKNTFAKAGTAGKAGMIGAGIVGAGLLAKGASSMFGGKKD